MKQLPRQKQHQTASTADSVRKLQGDLVPSFLKALYISREDTIFDEDEHLKISKTSLNMGLDFPKSQTNSAEGALSAPEALKLRMHELSNRSKSSIAVKNNSIFAEQTPNRIMQNSQ